MFLLICAIIFIIKLYKSIANAPKLHKFKILTLKYILTLKFLKLK